VRQRSAGKPGEQRHAQDASPDTKPPLSERSQLVLKVLLRANASDSDHRMRTEDIAAKAIGPTADANQFKEVIVELKAHGYVDTKKGRGGGCWLTNSGQRRAEKL
jgi:DNA-binding IscR family transcriptional regulator